MAPSYRGGAISARAADGSCVTAANESASESTPVAACRSSVPTPPCCVASLDAHAATEGVRAAELSAAASLAHCFLATLAQTLTGQSFVEAQFDSTRQCDLACIMKREERWKDKVREQKARRHVQLCRWACKRNADAELVHLTAAVQLFQQGKRVRSSNAVNQDTCIGLNTQIVIERGML